VNKDLQRMGLTWEEVEASAQDRQTWRQRVALCIEDAGWIKDQTIETKHWRTFRRFVHHRNSACSTNLSYSYLAWPLSNFIVKILKKSITCLINVKLPSVWLLSAWLYLYILLYHFMLYYCIVLIQPLAVIRNKAFIYLSQFASCIVQVAVLRIR